MLVLKLNIPSIIEFKVLPSAGPKVLYIPIVLFYPLSVQVALLM